MQKQRGFSNLIFLVLVLCVMAIGAVVYFVLQPESLETVSQKNLTETQDSSSTQNQLPEKEADSKPQIDKGDTVTNTVNIVDKIVSTSNSFGLKLDRLSDYIRKTKEEYGTYWYFDIQNNKIIYTDMGGVTIENAPPAGCSLPIFDTKSALVFADVDNQYLIADNKLFWRCETVGPIDTVNLRAFVNPSVILSDGKSIVAEGKKISIIDPKTFGPVTFTQGRDANERNFTNYYKDSMSVYYRDEEDDQIKKLLNSDPKTFEMLTGRTTQNYAKDLNHSYFNGFVLPTKNMKEFEVLVDGSYAIDENSIYVNGKTIVTGIKKNDVEVYSSNLPASQQYGGTQDVLIKDNVTNKWQFYKFDDTSLSQIPAPSSKEIGQVFYPKP